MSLIPLASCKKTETLEVDNETQSVVDYAIADQEFLTIVTGIMNAAHNTPGLSSANTFTTCDSLSYTSGDRNTFSPHPVFSADVSGTSCAALFTDGKGRVGNVFSRFSGKITEKGSKVVLKLVDYLTSDIHYTCDSMLITVEEVNAEFSSYQIKLVNGLCKTAAYNIHYEFSRTIRIDNENNNLAIVYGTSVGHNRNGKSFSTIILSNGLKKFRNCRYIAEGLMELTPEGFQTRQIDFGVGTCDDLATFTVKENTVAFKLK